MIALPQAKHRKRPDGRFLVFVVQRPLYTLRALSDPRQAVHNDSLTTSGQSTG
ncbi:hypothetical protein KPSA1_01069 [Pseudomonas syringae pv. actinidiae]|uniref:Uncharacterized protein n=1 Tax=Pseudomonas syringae pv. actinidiae TaxID=103796 RepID=A0A2V0Q504_PSESF|nr:hypothetical protein KPSA1_01069 [Pseudomonas syringae pv. actinidiae]GBH20253.1 hypothetical protein KPSA3_06277 [Pseudomonas syringae pv. actinidiae]